MASKRFKGKLCVYCSSRPSTTGDHVFARQFFMESARQNLPQAPACETCNNEKSKLEHYLATVLPFGGRHVQAAETLTTLVPGRLAKNLNLARDLNAGRGHVWHMENGVMRLAMVIPIDSEQATSLFGMIARALASLHFGVTLLPEHASGAIFLSSTGQEYYSRVFAMNAARRVHCDLGRGAVRYMGAQSPTTPELTVWRMKFYGGISMSGDPRIPGGVSSEIGAATGSRHAVDILTDQDK
ncbi:hypothetical protein [Paucibacter soli]|uniref:hypothetical protein n=1 Tax=Paucibacter soli TaxID=3133433 RepID=UPI0030B6BB2D